MEFNLSHGSQIEASQAGAQVPSSGVEPPPKPSPLNCPVCGVPMVPSQRWGRRIETCAEHGIWLVKDEVRQRFGWVLRANVPFAVLCGLQINIRHLLTTTFVVAVMLAVGKLGFDYIESLGDVFDSGRMPIR